MTIAEAAKILGVVPCAVHRWLGDGFIAGERLPPGHRRASSLTTSAPAWWRRHHPAGRPCSNHPGAGHRRRTVLQRVKRGELEAVHVRAGRRKGLRIKVERPRPSLFDEQQQVEGAVC